ncbi:unnamed protein product [Rotaria sp. Silwood2]|nr:unnamed protein product [Rotaria sp. Silwood2]CAF3029892.1 unnamed protein product [Rotaria sp. Silwood2]CAF3196030.1 unnamed protein product [Rotaria sp. Silwood2]
MSNQVFITSPKLLPLQKSLAVLVSEKYSPEQIDSRSEPNTPIGQPTQPSNDNKSSKIKINSSIRINPPQPIIDSSLDWDDDDQCFGHRSTFIRRQRQKYKESFSRIRVDTLQHGAISSIVSAPIVELSAPLIGSNTTDHSIALKREESTDSDVIQGQTLLHLAAKLGHEEIMRMLISETSHANMLLNIRGQTPLLCAIEYGSTSTAILLMEHDPLSLLCKDNIGSSVFHYAAEQSNYIVLCRTLSLLKRLSSSAARLIALQRLIEKNSNGKTPFVIAIEKGSLKCIKYILSSKWLHRNVDIGDFINADSLKATIDEHQLDIAAFFVSDTRRIAAIIQIRIYANGRVYNVLEYSIALKKPDFVRIFISVRIPTEEHELYRSYKYFLRHYNVPYSGSTYDQTPIQRMLTMVRKEVKRIMNFSFHHMGSLSIFFYDRQIHWLLKINSLDNIIQFNQLANFRKLEVT